MRIPPAHQPPRSHYPHHVPTQLVRGLPRCRCLLPRLKDCVAVGLDDGHPHGHHAPALAQQVAHLCAQAAVELDSAAAAAVKVVDASGHTCRSVNGRTKPSISSARVAGSGGGSARRLTSGGSPSKPSPPAARLVVVTGGASSASPSSSSGSAATCAFDGRSGGSATVKRRSVLRSAR